jgi:hypothetical protein
MDFSPLVSIVSMGAVFCRYIAGCALAAPSHHLTKNMTLVASTDFIALQQWLTLTSALILRSF